MKTSPLGVHWFRHDLRVADNGALFELASRCDALICIFVVDPRWFRPSHFQSAHIGKHRWRFLLESLQDLDQQLRLRGQSLLVKWGDPNNILNTLLREHPVTHLAFNHHSGVYERQQIQRLKLHNDHVTFLGHHGHSLFYPEQLPFTLDELPDTFTPFRKKVENIQIDRPSQAPEILPSAPSSIDYQWPDSLPDSPSRDQHGFVGGSSAALRQLSYYTLESDLLAQYKQTRNGLDGWDFSSKLSCWLANGSLSARQVYRAIQDYEVLRCANESTYWLYFELLWREFFYWYGRHHASALFQFSGVKGRKPMTGFWPQRFARWCAGNTPYPIVNACMKQLNATGFMSNRGRQLVASCLVHELNLDWRYGAAYFEQQLIDFDVASNYGNWQYLAGVGADPRGHRRFDLDKQTRQYDPQGEFIQRWQGESQNIPLDNVDPADWPIHWQ